MPQIRNCRNLPASGELVSGTAREWDRRAPSSISMWQGRRLFAILGAAGTPLLRARSIADALLERRGEVLEHCLHLLQLRLLALHLPTVVHDDFADLDLRRPIHEDVHEIVV